MWNNKEEMEKRKNGKENSDYSSGPCSTIDANAALTRLFRLKPCSFFLCISRDEQ